MTRPPFGLCLPCRPIKVRDGDTVEVQAASGLLWAIRLIDCWCPESRGRQKQWGQEAKAVCKQFLDKHALTLAVQVPVPEELVRQSQALGLDHEPRLNLLSLLTFDRVPGWLWLDQRNRLNDVLVERGQATRTKAEARAKWGEP